jgi:TPR repeat protein
VFCVLCRYLLNRYHPGWAQEADKLRDAYLFYGLNNDAIFAAEADSTRLREIHEMSRGRPAEALAEFLPLAEGGSVWSMIQVGYAYEAGRGAPIDRVRAEEWYSKAYEGGSDFGLLRVAILAFRRGDIAKARTVLDVGVGQGLTRAMDYLAWVELRLSGKEETRRQARALYEQAIASGDFAARMSYARAMARGRFGWREIPKGVRSLRAVAKDFTAQVDAIDSERPDVRNFQKERSTANHRLWGWRWLASRR